MENNTIATLLECKKIDVKIQEAIDDWFEDDTTNVKLDVIDDVYRIKSLLEKIELETCGFQCCVDLIKKCIEISSDESMMIPLDSDFLVEILHRLRAYCADNLEHVYLDPMTVKFQLVESLITIDYPERHVPLNILDEEFRQIVTEMHEIFKILPEEDAGIHLLKRDVMYCMVSIFNLLYVWCRRNVSCEGYVVQVFAFTNIVACTFNVLKRKSDEDHPFHILQSEYEEIDNMQLFERHADNHDLYSPDDNIPFVNDQFDFLDENEEEDDYESIASEDLGYQTGADEDIEDDIED